MEPSSCAGAVVIATGACSKKPKLAGLQPFEGPGVRYGANCIEAQLCVDEDVIIVGGGNSAGQAAIFLSQTARKVYMLVRAEDVSQTMSRCLIERISGNPVIELLCQTELIELQGSESLQEARWMDKTTQEVTCLPVRHIFVMAGASPNTDWLRGCLALDDKGFILTVRDLPLFSPREVTPPWPLRRAPQYPLMTARREVISKVVKMTLRNA